MNKLFIKYFMQSLCIFVGILILPNGCTSSHNTRPTMSSSYTEQYTNPSTLSPLTTKEPEFSSRSNNSSLDFYQIGNCILSLGKDIYFVKNNSIYKMSTGDYTEKLLVNSKNDISQFFFDSDEILYYSVKESDGLKLYQHDINSDLFLFGDISEIVYANKEYIFFITGSSFSISKYCFMDKSIERINFENNLDIIDTNVFEDKGIMYFSYFRKYDLYYSFNFITEQVRSIHIYNTFINKSLDKNYIAEYNLNNNGNISIYDNSFKHIALFELPWIFNIDSYGVIDDNLSVFGCNQNEIEYNIFEFSISLKKEKNKFTYYKPTSMQYQDYYKQCISLYNGKWYIYMLIPNNYINVSDETSGIADYFYSTPKILRFDPSNNSLDNIYEGTIEKIKLENQPFFFIIDGHLWLYSYNTSNDCYIYDRIIQLN